MHAVLITFRTSVRLEDLRRPFADYAHALCDVEGLVAKTWIGDGEAVGGFHIFVTRAAAETYLGSEMVAGLTGNPAFTDFEIRHFQVLDELSAITGSPQRTLVTSS